MLLPFYNDTVVEAGLDEAGRGCLAGPVVAAAVVFPKGYSNSFLNDSKQLTKSQRNNLISEIKNNSLNWSIGICSQFEIDEINILNASILAMHKAVDSLSIKPEHLLVDGNRFKPYLGVAHTCIIKGDTKYQSIAAASILAKTYRDNLMAELSVQYPEYGWEKNAGYPTVFHRKAIKEFGLTEHHRLTFRIS